MEAWSVDSLILISIDLVTFLNQYFYRIDNIAYRLAVNAAYYYEENRSALTLLDVCLCLSKIFTLLPSKEFDSPCNQRTTPRARVSLIQKNALTKKGVASTSEGG